MLFYFFGTLFFFFFFPPPDPLSIFPVNLHRRENDADCSTPRRKAHRGCLFQISIFDFGNHPACGWVLTSWFCRTVSLEFSHNIGAGGHLQVQRHFSSTSDDYISRYFVSLAYVRAAASPAPPLTIFSFFWWAVSSSSEGRVVAALLIDILWLVSLIPLVIQATYLSSCQSPDLTR